MYIYIYIYEPGFLYPDKKPKVDIKNQIWGGTPDHRRLILLPFPHLQRLNEYTVALISRVCDSFDCACVCVCETNDSSPFVVYRDRREHHTIVYRDRREHHTVSSLVGMAWGGM